MNDIQAVRSRPRVAPVLCLAIGLVLGWGAAAAFRATPALAQQGLPNAALQRDNILKAIKGTNERLDELQKLLESGNVVVQVQEPGGDVKGKDRR